MAKKTKTNAVADDASPPAGTTPELGLEGKGVAPVKINDVDKAISRYERAKEKRCQASPAEIAAKQELAAMLHHHKDSLPRNEEGNAFYRHEGRDYVLEEKLKCRKVDDGTDEE